MHKPAFSRVACAAAVCVVSLASFLAVAEATRTVRLVSHISIRGRGLTFSGHVRSPNPACKNNRRVTLYRTSSLELGSVTTGASGGWTITVSGSAGITLGHFYARVGRRSEGAAGTIYVCRAARSRTIPYRP